MAKADGSQAKEPGALGIQIAPAKDGDKGVAIVGVDPNGTAAEQGLADGRRHPRCRRQARVEPGGREGRNREREEPGQEGGHDAHSDRRRRARFVAVPFPKA